MTGPAGPEDPALSLIAFQSPDGRPLAMLANFSMHYFGGHPGVSADYFGLFCRRLAEQLAPGRADFLAIMSQGISGDLWWGDYSQPPRQRTFEEYTEGLVELAL